MLACNLECIFFHIFTYELRFMTMRILKNVVLFVVLLSVSSCNLFKREKVPVNSPDTLSVQPTLIETPVIDSTEFVPIVQEEEPVVISNNPVIGYSAEKYYMVVGSFLSEKLADKYANTIIDMGYQANVIYSNADGFYRVTAQRYNDMATAVSDIQSFRNNVTNHAWVHVKR